MRKLFIDVTVLAARYLPQRAKQTVYRFPPVARLIRQQLNRAVPVGLTQVEIAGGKLAGFYMLLDLRSEKDYWLGTYEPDLQEAITGLVQPGMVAYDLGANIGYITLLLARCVGESGQVVAIEALPDNLERLDNNITLNKLDPIVKIVHGAVVERSQQVDFYIGPSDGMGKVEGSAGRQDVVYSETIAVQGIALDDFVFQSGNPVPQFVKIDIEGGEVLAFQGMKRVLNDARPIVLMELHGPEAAVAAWQALTDAGYQICYMKPDFPIVTGPEVLDWKAYLASFPPR
ncbi:MAG: FkbM family methyltransferase [Chloroflexota bacterium]|nr:FkbM family methyltransferase [Chloroflexota bacterium]